MIELLALSTGLLTLGCGALGYALWQAKQAPEFPEPPACSPEAAVLHIARFERAVDQCSDPKRKRHLQSQLNYYRHLAAAERP